MARQKKLEPPCTCFIPCQLSGGATGSIAPSIQRAPPSESRGERLTPLQLTSAIHDGALTVEFALHNPLEVDIYVDQYQPSRDWPPERCGYVYVHREDRLLVLYFGTVPNPPLVRLAQEMKFYTERLAPAQTLHAAIRLPLPVLENGKLALADAAAPHEVVEVDRVRCTVCYTPKNELGSLLDEVLQPPVERIGALDADDFLPERPAGPMTLGDIRRAVRPPSTALASRAQ